MAVFVRAKRVTDPLNDKVKATLFGACGDCRKTAGWASSGSEHAGDSSACLSNLIQGFLEDDFGTGPPEDDDDHHHHHQDSEGGDVVDLEQTRETLQELFNPNDPFCITLLSYVSKAVEAFTGLRSNRAVFRRAVMTYLRDCGYNAGICKTKWESSGGGITGGNYEFIDVVVEEKGRYLVEVDLAGEFEIARPSEEYERILGFLPEIYVVRWEELKKIISVVSEAAKRSLHSRKLHIPPWRKNRYMQAKWFGPYKRTTVGQMMAIFPPECKIQCRSVGFHAVPAVSFTMHPR
ncbi:uncharacterized protein LOC143890896 [Tasmannia lanceolata]|uniref:uncharacterized protein LOC143890896 n=1 Tax=Tasmannia lanceolata TaxID=3420 RepID=UPI004063A82D